MNSKFGMETKFDKENTGVKGKLEIDTHLINYAWFVKTDPMNSKFDMETKFDTENTKIKKGGSECPFAWVNELIRERRR